MKRYLALLIIPIMLFFSACSSSDDGFDFPDAEPILLKAGFENKVLQDNIFAFDLFKSVYMSENESNLFISPLSVSMALSMVLNGANGETREEMESALRLSGYSSEEINEYCKTLREALINVDPSTQIAIANSIWYRLGFYVENSFIQTNRINYSADVKELDFGDPNTMKQINQWCANSTNNKIPQVIEEIPDNLIMYLINAVYFKGIWKYKFQNGNTGTEYFYEDSKQKKEVQMMKQDNNFDYNFDENAGYLELPYGNKAFSMVLILPHDGKTIDNVISNLDNNSWNEIISGFSSTKVNLHLPRFKSECEYNLHEKILPLLGMEQAFQPFKADFRGINRNRDLYISEVKHKSFIEVNEEGTEAAAITSVGVMVTSVGDRDKSLDFIVNKPFLYIIKEQSTGVILFMGKMQKI